MAIATGLISYWKLDEASGNAADAKGSNTLTNSNSSSYVAGKIGNAIDLERGTNADQLIIADASQSGLDIPGSLSISAWVNFESLPGVGETWAIVSKWGAAGNRGYDFGYKQTAGPGFQANFSNDGTTVTGTGTNWTITPSLATWYHVVMVYNALAGTADLYINGVAQTQVSSMATSLFNSSQQFAIGTTDTGGVNRRFDGLIDEVGIWNRVLKSSEIDILYNSGNGLSYPFKESSFFRNRLRPRIFGPGLAR